MLTQAQIGQTLDRIGFQAQVKEVVKTSETKKHPALKKVEKFHEWLDSAWTTYIRVRVRVRVRANPKRSPCFLSYGSTKKIQNH